MNEFLKRAMELNDSILADRHYLHQNAEVGMELPVTTKYVLDRLTAMGIEAKELCKSGVVGLIKGKKPAKCICFVRTWTLCQWAKTTVCLANPSPPTHITAVTICTLPCFWLQLRC